MNKEQIKRLRFCFSSLEKAQGKKEMNEKLLELLAYLKGCLDGLNDKTN